MRLNESTIGRFLEELGRHGCCAQERALDRVNLDALARWLGQFGWSPDWTVISTSYATLMRFAQWRRVGNVVWALDGYGGERKENAHA